MAGSVLFLTENESAVNQFIREYVLGAIERVEDITDCEGISFDRDEQLNPEGDSVVLIVFGEFDAFVESEQERWEEQQESGLIQDWKTKPLDEEQLEWKFGQRGSELAKRLMPLGGEMAKLAYEQFDKESFPDPINSDPNDDGWMPVGWWTVPHHVTVGNLGYSPSEEIEMCLAAIEEDLRIIAEREGEESVDREINGMTEQLEAMREKVKDGRPRPGASSTN